MADIIQLLPDSIANQIAAGEVVQRPASVVKELLENCLDAGAVDIQVIIRDAGKASIQVIDNGSGMSITDARMCFERHATSKIRSSEDLYTIRTMGFRGEALASVAAVAQVELKTRRAADELGTLVQVDGSEFIRQEPVAMTPGTSILVKNLFYNVPARRNFLKSAPVEMKHIIDEFQHIAISAPEVAMRLFHNDLEIYNLPVGNLGKRIVNLFGKNYREQLVTCTEETEHVNIRGYIGKPQFSKKTRGEQFLFVNKRYIKSNYLNHAVATAYEGLIAQDHFPFFTIFLDVEPGHVDVNVHPSKTEVKFLDERSLYSVLRSVVKQALGTHNVTPSLDFDNNVNFSLKSEFGGQASGKTVADLNYERLRSREFGNLKNWEAIFEGQQNMSGQDHPAYDLDADNVQNELPGQKMGNNTQLGGGEMVTPSTFQVHNRFILAQVKSGLMIIDQMAAYYRIIYEQNIKKLRDKQGHSQKLMFPATMELNPTDLSLVMEIRDEIGRLGFEVEPFGSQALIINGVPSGMVHFNEKEVFEELLEQYKHNRDKLNLDIHENLARSVSRYAASRYGKILSAEERRLLIDQLFGCSNPNYSPSGEPVYSVVNLNQLENLLKKKT